MTLIRPSYITATSIAAGLLTALVFVAVAVAVVASQPQRWNATSSLLVLPKADEAPPDLVAGLYDALSRGQVPATFAELLRDRSLEMGAAEQLGLTEAETQDVSLEILVVPETSVLDLTVTAQGADVAESVAARAQADAAAYLSRLDSPYEVVVAGAATGTARRDGLSPLPLAAVVTVLAVLGGVAVQQAVMALSRASNVRARPVESAATTASFGMEEHPQPGSLAPAPDRNKAPPDIRFRRPS